MHLDLERFSRLNRERAVEGFKTYQNVPLTYWTTALAGEVGELCNMIKKLERVAHGGIDGGSSYTAASLTDKDLAEEFGGIFIYLDILASLKGINLPEAIVETFNGKSDKYKFTQKYNADTENELSYSFSDLVSFGNYLLGKERTGVVFEKNYVNTADYDLWKIKRSERMYGYGYSEKNYPASPDDSLPPDTTFMHNFAMSIPSALHDPIPPAELKPEFQYKEVGTTAGKSWCEAFVALKNNEAAKNQTILSTSADDVPHTKGVSLIAQERWEQIHKHGFDETNDEDYDRGQLVQAACFCIDKYIESAYGVMAIHDWPYGWGSEFKNKILAKNHKGKLKVAGAFIAAEIDRIIRKEKEKQKLQKESEQTFEDYIIQARRDFSKDISADGFWYNIPPEKRVIIENLLIAYDQMNEKIQQEKKTSERNREGIDRIKDLLKK